LKRNHCIKCGKIIGKIKKKYCIDCSVIAKKEGNRRRGKRYREKYGNEQAKNWIKEHPEQRRLHSRNYYHRNPEKHKLSLQTWRKQNPEKLRLQRKRARKNQRRRADKILNSKGIYKKIKKSVICPKCNHKFKTSAKRPQCKCGYNFSRDFINNLIEKSKITLCKCCGREVYYQGRGVYRKYCECCFPQIQALKSVQTRMRFDKKRPKRFQEWYQNTSEVVVAMTCRACGNFIIYKGKGVFPQKCDLCRGIERARPKPIWNPKDTRTFIDVEKHRLGLHKKKKWNWIEVKQFYDYWEKRSIHNPQNSSVPYEE